jgi:hypothetical protein
MPPRGPQPEPKPSGEAAQVPPFSGEAAKVPLCVAGTDAGCDHSVEFWRRQNSQPKNGMEAVFRRLTFLPFRIKC